MKQFTIMMLILALCACASAQTTRFNPPDPRLDTKVTLDMAFGKLDMIATKLSEQTGVTIKAGSSTRDWKVREQRVMVHAKDVPAGILLEEIARLLGFSISREGKEGEWAYIIWQDKKSRDLEAEMLNAQKEAEAQRIARQRQAGIDLANKALGMSPADAMKQKDSNPLLAYLGGTKSGRGYAQLLASFGTNFPTEYELMMRGKRAFIPLSGLPQDMQQALSDASSGPLSNSFKGGNNVTPYQMVMAPAPDVFGGEFAGLVPQMANMGMMLMTGLSPGQKPDPNGWMGGGSMVGVFPLVDGSTPMGKLAGQLLLDGENGVPADQLYGRMDKASKDPEFQRAVEARESPTEKNPPTDPELTREVEIQDLSKELKQGMDPVLRLNAMMTELSRATGYPVLVEAYRKPRPLDLYFHAGKQPLSKLLIGIEKAGYTWTKGTDKTIRIRPEDWAFRRSCMIAESYLKAYDPILLKQGYFTMDDVASMIAGLTEDQWRAQICDDWFAISLLGRLAQDGVAEREILRAYASFTSQQKSALATEVGLPFWQLTDEQWEHIYNAIADKMSGAYISAGSIRLLPQTDKQIQDRELARTFEINAVTGDQKEPSKLEFSMSLTSAGKQEAQTADVRKALEVQKAQQK